MFIMKISISRKTFFFIKNTFNLRTSFFYLFGTFFFLSTTLMSAQHGLGTNTPNSSTILYVSALDKGVLIPSISLNSSTAGAFASDLKLPRAGYRDGFTGSIYGEGSSGGCWTSSVDSDFAYVMAFGGSYANRSLSDE